MILVNAIYFKGPWQYPFDIKRTDERIFHTNINVKQSIPMMKNKQRYAHGELPALKSKFLEIGYAVSV